MRVPYPQACEPITKIKVMGFVNVKSIINFYFHSMMHSNVIWHGDNARVVNIVSELRFILNKQEEEKGSSRLVAREC